MAQCAVLGGRLYGCSGRVPPRVLLPLTTHARRRPRDHTGRRRAVPSRRAGAEVLDAHRGRVAVQLAPALADPASLTPGPPLTGACEFIRRNSQDLWIGVSRDLLITS